MEIGNDEKVLSGGGRDRELGWVTREKANQIANAGPPSTEAESSDTKQGWVTRQKATIGPPAVESQGGEPGHVTESKKRTLDKAVPSTQAVSPDTGSGHVTREKAKQIANAGPPSTFT